jgi:hypothetical protein
MVECYTETVELPFVQLIIDENMSLYGDTITAQLPHLIMKMIYCLI